VTLKKHEQGLIQLASAAACRSKPLPLMRCASMSTAFPPHRLSKDGRRGERIRPGGLAAESWATVGETLREQGVTITLGVSH
jgi:cobalt-precorrin 5A hydrolase